MHRCLHYRIKNICKFVILIIIMENIAILTGGDSAEYDISLLSANTVFKHLDHNIYKRYIIHLKNNIFTTIIDNKEIVLDKKDFSFIYNSKKIEFKKVFMALHGPPAENGIIQLYFDKLNITYTGCKAKIASLTFNKYQCNSKLKDLGFNCARSYLYTKNKKIDKNIIKKLGFPCFVKPNASGSSFGVSKVNNESELDNAIKKALKHDDQVIIEEFINGTEVSSGVFYNGKKIIALPITEIISDNDFFDYEAKYHGKSQEITPARISKRKTKEIQETSINVYKKILLKGICRIDYIIMKNKIYIIEINTIPGLSEESIIPKQIKSGKFQISQIFQTCLLNTK